MIVNNHFRKIKVKINERKIDLFNIDINLFYVKEFRNKKIILCF